MREVIFNSKPSQIDPKTRELTFIAISPDGEMMFAKGIGSFAREHQLIKQAIQSCLSGRALSHKGWKFERIEEDYH